MSGSFKKHYPFFHIVYVTSCANWKEQILHSTVLVLTLSNFAFCINVLRLVVNLDFELYKSLVTFILLCGCDARTLLADSGKKRKRSRLSKPRA